MATVAKMFGKSVLIAGLLLLISSPAIAASPAKCGDRTTLITILKNKYREAPVAMGISQASTEAFEIFTSKTGTWTVIMTTSSGMTCIMATGHSWKDIPKRSPDPHT